jgi:hypothetical protein
MIKAARLAACCAGKNRTKQGALRHKNDVNI